MNQRLKISAASPHANIKIEIKKVYLVDNQLHVLVECKDEPDTGCEDACHYLNPKEVIVETNSAEVLPVTYYLVNHKLRQDKNRHTDFLKRYDIYEGNVAGTIDNPATRFSALFDVSSYDELVKNGISVYQPPKKTKRDLAKLLKQETNNKVDISDELLSTVVSGNKELASRLINQYPVSKNILENLYANGQFKNDEVTNHNFFYDVIGICSQFYYFLGSKVAEQEPLLIGFYATICPLLTPKSNKALTVSAQDAYFWTSLEEVTQLIKRLLPASPEALLTLLKYPRDMLAIAESLEKFELWHTFIYHILLTDQGPRCARKFSDALEQVLWYDESTPEWLTHDRFLDVITHLHDCKSLLFMMSRLNSVGLLEKYYDQALAYTSGRWLISNIKSKELLSEDNIVLALSNVNVMTAFAFAKRVQAFTSKIYSTSEEEEDNILEMIFTNRAARAAMVELNEWYSDACTHLKLRDPTDETGAARQLRTMAAETINELANMVAAQSRDDGVSQQGMFANTSSSIKSHVAAFKDQLGTFIDSVNVGEFRYG